MSPAHAGATAAQPERQALLARFRRRDRWKPAEYLVWLVPVAAYFVFPDNYLFMSQIAIMALFALSLDLIFGYAGIISLGHAAFFGIGAYAVGLLGSHGWGDPLLGLAVAALAAGAVGFLSSFLLLRGHDLSRLMVTLGVALMLYEVANKFTSVTGGQDGMPDIEVKPLLGLFEFDFYGQVGYIYSVVVLLLVFIVARRLVHSPFGQSLRGIQMNAFRMPALGVSVTGRLVRIYTVGAVFAGMAGALLAQTTQFVSVDVLSFQRSADLLLIVILGGSGYLYGGLLGAVVYMIMNHLLSGLDPQYWQFWAGVLLVLLILFARGGILGTAADWLDARRDRRARAAREAAP